MTNLCKKECPLRVSFERAHCKTYIVALKICDCVLLPDSIRRLSEFFISEKGLQTCAGDDCISIVSNSSRVVITGLFCGPGHGIRYIQYSFLLVATFF